MNNAQRLLTQRPFPQAVLQGGIPPSPTPTFISNKTPKKNLSNFTLPTILILGSCFLLYSQIICTSNITEKNTLYCMFIVSLSGTVIFFHSRPQIYSVAEEEDDLDLVILLPPTTKYWDYVCHHTHFAIRREQTQALCMIRTHSTISAIAPGHHCKLFRDKRCLINIVFRLSTIN